MNILKIETNYTKKQFLCEYKNIKISKYLPRYEKEMINIYPNVKYQSFLGFGGAFTEATGYALSLLPEEKRKQAISDYFSSEGLNYNFCRLPIGSSDFSVDSYSYSKKADLSDFSIERDKKYIIPTIHEAFKFNSDIKFLASPWSPPKFMKNNKMLILGGKLLDKYKSTYADYFVKYLDEYRKEHINIDYITVQNEANAIQIWESCLYSPEEERDFIVNHLFPTFEKNNINTKILIWDHNKEKLYSRTKQEINSEYAKKAISGIAFHWYMGGHFENIHLVHTEFPDKLLIHTEGCTGFSNFNPNDEIHNAEIYAHDIIGDLNSGTNAYIDWNLVLDNNGGPNHKKNYCNSPIMISQDNTDYIKNLTYYYIAHFSKYIKPNAKCIAFSRYSVDIELTAFENPDNTITLVLLNKFGFSKPFNININDEIIFKDIIEPHSIITYILNKN